MQSQASDTLNRTRKKPVLVNKRVVAPHLWNYMLVTGQTQPLHTEWIELRCSCAHLSHQTRRTPIRNRTGYRWRTGEAVKVMVSGTIVACRTANDSGYQTAKWVMIGGPRRIMKYAVTSIMLVIRIIMPLC